MTLGIEAELNAFAVAMITDVQISIQKEGDAASAALEKKKRGKHADKQSKKWSSSVALYEDGRFLPWEQSEIDKIQQLNAHLLITFWRWGTVLRPTFLSDPKCRDWGQEITPKVFIPTNQIEMLGASRASRLDGVVWWQWGRIPGRYTEPKTQINTWKHSEEYSERRCNHHTHVME